MMETEEQEAYMEITLEKIELVKDRTGVTYREAKEALEESDGSVVDAIINIEEKINYDEIDEGESGFSNSELFKKIKETAKKGNMSRIIIRKGSEILLNLPITVSVLGAVIAPWGVIFGLIAAVGFNCKIEFINDKGEMTDVNGKAKVQYDKVKERSHKAYDKGHETINKIRESETYNDLKDKSGEILEEIKDKSEDVIENIKQKKEGIRNGSEGIEEILDPASPVIDIDDASDDVEEVLKSENLD